MVEKFLDQVISTLNSGAYNLFDAESAFAEYYEDTGSFAAPREIIDIDAFDYVSIPVFPANNCPRVQNHLEPDWEAWAADILSGKICFWDCDDDLICPAPAGSKEKPSPSLNCSQMTVTRTPQETLAEFASWAGTPVDILSCYGDYDYDHKAAESFVKKTK